MSKNISDQLVEIFVKRVLKRFMQLPGNVLEFGPLYLKLLMVH